MKDEPKRPLSVWITQGILLLSTVFFTVLNAYSFAYESNRLGQILYSTLLVVLPVIALTGLFTRASWARRAATLALLCMWAFQLRSLWGFGTLDYFLEAFLGGGYFTAFILMLAGFAIGVPLLLLKLYRGEAESEFFTKSRGKFLAASNALSIGDAVPDFDENLFSQDTDLLYERKG